MGFPQNLHITMTMILQLLIAAVAVGLSVAAAPPYKEDLQAIQEATKTLEKHVFSLGNNPALLNDSRRHYSEIIHVVYSHGEHRSGCLKKNYYEEYYPYLEISASEAISDPKLVVTKLTNLRNDVHNNIAELKHLINACVQGTEGCNELIHDTVLKNPDDYAHAAKVLFAAGDVSKNLNKLNEKFEEVSKKLKAHQYVCTSPQDLENMVESVGQLYGSLYLFPHGC